MRSGLTRRAFALSLAAHGAAGLQSDSGTDEYPLQAVSRRVTPSQRTSQARALPARTRLTPGRAIIGPMAVPIRLCAAPRWQASVPNTRYVHVRLSAVRIIEGYSRLRSPA
jgi:hypothetical protein